jgi:hypothetical protein
MQRFFVLLAVCCLLGASITEAGSAQKIKRINPPKAITGEEVVQSPNYQAPGYPSTYSAGPGDSIGYTTYDYGTNGSSMSNVLNYGATLAVGRMAAHDLSASTLDRDSWYTCSLNGGNTFQPMGKVEVVRRGWSQLVDLSGIAGTVSHTGLEVNRDAALCSRTWTSTTYSNTTHLWPRAVGTSNGSLHIVSGNANPPTDIVYTRSTDGGATFDLIGVSIATAGTFVPDADGYDIVTDGTNIAVILAGVDGDVVLVASGDNGSTWLQTTIYDIDETNLTEEDVPDGSVAGAYDNDGDLHIAWGTYYASGEGPDSLFYSVGAGIYHWSFATGVQEIAIGDTDVVSLGIALMRDGNIATQPDIAIDENNGVCITYSTFVNEFDVYGNIYSHVYGVSSPDAGATWGAWTDLTPGTGFDAAFPSIASVADDNVHMVYECDPYAGNWLQGSALGQSHPHIQVAIMYNRIPKGDFSPLLCSDIDQFQARCIGGGTIQARIVLQNSTIHAGKVVSFQVDEDVYTATIGTNGTHSRAVLQVSGVGLGAHTIDLIDPLGCFNTFNVTCATAKAGDVDWNTDWDFGLSGTAEATTPAETRLLGNYPNPFNPSTTIRYALNEEMKVSVRIYNVLGQEVATLFDGVQKAGEQSVIWNGTNNAGNTVASGLYIYKVQAGNTVLSSKMLFAK